jgi:hypothetical protein
MAINLYTFYMDILEIYHTKKKISPVLIQFMKKIFNGDRYEQFLCTYRIFGQHYTLSKYQHASVDTIIACLWRYPSNF